MQQVLGLLILSSSLPLLWLALRQNKPARKVDVPEVDDPARYDLCSRHASRFRPPHGWELTVDATDSADADDVRGAVLDVFADGARCIEFEFLRQVTDAEAASP